MIISHEHKFIFIKNRKVGSTSVELALQTICGPDDVLTPDHLHQGEDDVLRPLARNYEGSFNPTHEFLMCRTPMEFARVMRDKLQRPKFYNHMRASSVKGRVASNVWDTYYKFTFERNPWDKAISFYYWFGRSRTLPSFNEFVKIRRRYGTNDQVLPSDWSRYTLHNKIIVDDVFNYADLSGGLHTGLKRAGVDAKVIESITLSQEKASIRQNDPIPWDDEVDLILRQTFSREIETFTFCRSPLPGLFVY